MARSIPRRANWHDLCRLRSGNPSSSTTGPAGWSGLFAPSGIPPSRAGVLRAALQRALEAPEFLRRAREQGNEVLDGSEGTLQMLLSTDYKRWGELIPRAASALNKGTGA